MSTQLEGQDSLLGTQDRDGKGPVECLGLTFESDEARRSFFLAELKKKLADPEFRKIDGFPIGSDDDILRLSDPPYYTACPNPFLQDFVRCYGKRYEPALSYAREPFATDVSEGKSDPIYNVHSYHTKVPHKAIMRYILHYTEPGDIIFDGFAGTGMTGVAATACGDRGAVESLGYRVDASGTVSQAEANQDGASSWIPFAKIGTRRAVLKDLSPAATFIAHNYNTHVDIVAFEREAKRALKEVDAEYGWMYETLHTDGRTKGHIVYTVWSDVFLCPDCGGDVIYWNAAVDKDAGQVRDEFPCPHCHALLSKRKMKRALTRQYDAALGENISQTKQVPVLINYAIGTRTFEKVPSTLDFASLEKIERISEPHAFPTDQLPKGDKTGEPIRIGITHVHHFFTKRNRLVLASFFSRCESSLCRWLGTGVMQRASKQHQIAISRIGGPKEGEGGATAGHRRGTLYLPSNQVEFNPFLLLTERLKMALKAARSKSSEDGTVFIETASTTQTRIAEESIDYIFTDPPFGGNIMYSELNFIWESALRIRTNADSEAVTSKTQEKTLQDYESLMTQCFSEYFRVLKPGRWMTVEFHNSQNSVWSSIQEALQRAGFVVADVRVLDKKIKTHTQRTAGGSVNKDLAITAYKPNGGLEHRFKITAGTEEGAWDFVRTHLRQLPVFVASGGHAEIVAERQRHLLFDRMVAFHVQRGVTIPLSAAEFYAGLTQRFPEREGMYFLPEQIAEYDRKRMTARDVRQLEIFVRDESSAIQWLRQQLQDWPQTFQELHPQFLREIAGWSKQERPLELRDLLEENFLCYTGDGEVPSQIHRYLSSNFHDLRQLAKDSPALRRKAHDRWYVPDPKKASDLEKLRERALLREFDEYRDSKQKKLKLLRLEAIRAGFRRAWQENNYRTILDVAAKMPEDLLQEDPMLLMWYTNSQMRAGRTS